MPYPSRPSPFEPEHDQWAKDFDENFDRSERRVWRFAAVAMVLYSLLVLAIIAGIVAGIIWLVNR